MKRISIAIVTISIVMVAGISLLQYSPPKVVGAVVAVVLAAGMGCFLYYIWNFSDNGSGENLEMIIMICQGGEKHTQKKAVTKDRMVVGRGQSSDIVISADFIPEEYFAIIVEAGGNGRKKYFIEKLKPMRIKNRRTQKEVRLRERLNVDDTFIVQQDENNYVEFSFERS